MCKFESYSLIKSEIQNTRLGVYKRLALKTSKDGETMFIKDYNMASKFFRPRKRETGADCINFLNLLLATSSPKPRNLKKMDKRR
jgi:hypothetical protein